MEPFDRYQYFIKRVADFEVMYSLKNGDEWAIAELEDNKVFSLWSAEVFAKKNAVGEWSNFEPIEIDFDLFEDEIVPFITENNFLLNVFSVNGKSGFVVELEEFMRDLKEEIKKYE